MKKLLLIAAVVLYAIAVAVVVAQPGLGPGPGVNPIIGGSSTTGITNNQTGVTLTGTFNGDGSGLTNSGGLPVVFPDASYVLLPEGSEGWDTPFKFLSQNGIWYWGIYGTDEAVIVKEGDTWVMRDTAGGWGAGSNPGTIVATNTDSSPYDSWIMSASGTSFSVNSYGPASLPFFGGLSMYGDQTIVGNSFLSGNLTASGTISASVYVAPTNSATTAPDFTKSAQLCVTNDVLKLTAPINLPTTAYTEILYIVKNTGASPIRIDTSGLLTTRTNATDNWWVTNTTEVKFTHWPGEFTNAFATPRL